jgi:hypothetical protein
MSDIPGQLGEGPISAAAAVHGRRLGPAEPTIPCGRADLPDIIA